MIKQNNYVGFSFEELKKKYKKDHSYGIYLTFDSRVRCGLIIYFYKWCIGFWILRDWKLK